MNVRGRHGWSYHRPSPCSVPIKPSAGPRCDNGIVDGVGVFILYEPPDTVDNRRARASRPELYMAAPEPSPALPRLGAQPVSA
jgi:hypothetical protein